MNPTTTCYSVRIDVEHRGTDVYFVGPFRSESEACRYCEDFHGSLDGTQVIPLSRGMTTERTS